MARIKVTPINIKSKLQIWAQGNNLTDELVFLPSEGIDENEVINLGWQNGVIIISQADFGNCKKFTYKEKLL